MTDILYRQPGFEKEFLAEIPAARAGIPFETWKRQPDGIAARVDAVEAETDALDTILSPVLGKLLDANGENPSHWYLSEFDTDGKGMVRLTAEDPRDGETRTFKIPASVIDEGTVDDYCENLKNERAARAAERSRADKRRELERVEARARILRGELGGG